MIVETRLPDFTADIPRLWEWAEFADLVDVVSDGQRRIKQRSYLKSGSLQIVDQGESLVAGYTDDEEYAVPHPLPLLVFGDHTRRIKLLTSRFACGAEGVKLLRPMSYHDPRYVAWALGALPIVDRGYSRHFGFLRAIRVPLPPAKEQVRLCDRIDELFTELSAGVAALERVRKKLSRYRSAVLHAAVTGRLTAEWRKAHGPPAEPGEEAECKIKDPAKLRRLIADLIDRETWLNFDLDVKGEIYESLLSRSAAESTGGAGQYFTPRPIIRAMVDVMRPTPEDTIMDPAAGTGGFLTVAYQYVLDTHGGQMDKDEKKRAREQLVTGQELVPETARLCAMNLYLHGIGGADSSPVISGKSSLDHAPSKLYSMVLTNPPFGKKQSLKTVNEEGDIESEEEVIVRQDFWVSTANKQLNFVQHIFNLLKVGGRTAVVVPDNVLFEGGPGQKIREQLLKQCDVHTLLRLPTGVFYKPGVKANVLFFDRKPPQERPWTSKLWVYDLRTNKHFTQKQNPIRRADFDEFVELFKPSAIHRRKPTWAENKPDGRWRSFEYEELLKRDKLSLDLFWIKDETVEDSSTLPDPDLLAQEIVEDLEDALEQFTSIAGALKSTAKRETRGLSSAPRPAN